ncbi:MAG: acetylxylan esterase, partial [Armatimonadetes bacterium]|nr:acetylxylan esterase [Armatimonadota bacterium]
MDSEQLSDRTPESSNVERKKSDDERQATDSNLFSPYSPEDFDEFWAEAAQEAQAAPLDFQRSRKDSRMLDRFWVETFRFRGVSGETLHAWIAIPDEREGRAPAFLCIPAYGRESHLPDAYSTRRGMVSVCFNFFGGPAFHKEEYAPSRGYFAQRIEDPNTWVFRAMAQNCLIAVRVLRAQLEANEDRLAVAGFSQGGGMAVWTGALSPYIKAVCADAPFLSAMRYVMEKPVYRYPLKEVTDYAAEIPLGMERVMNTLSYFDTVNHATRLRAPTQVSFGRRDPACIPPTVRAVYDAVQVEKNLIEYDTGHDWNPGMIEANRAW